ncbi:MAG: glycosyltransferase family 4 protein [Halothiobacillus sp.]
MFESNRDTDGAVRILVITKNLPPTMGGMERLHWHVINELSRRNDVHVIGPINARSYMPRAVAITGVPLKPLPLFLFCTKIATIFHSIIFQPDIVIAGSGLTAPFAWLAARITGARCVVLLHGLDVNPPSRVFRWFWRPFFKHFDRVIAISRYTRELALSVGVTDSKIKIVHPGVDIPTLDETARGRFRSKYNLGDGPILISVGRLAARKGVWEFVTEVLPIIAAKQPNVVLAIIGDTPTQALHAELQSPVSIQAAADAVGVGSRIRFIGKISDKELLDAYQAADIHVFPIRYIPNDPEGFGMVAIEAAAAGSPTVAYAIGGVVDAISEGVSGYLVPPGDVAAFADAVLNLIEQPLPFDGIRDFAKGFSWSKFGERFENSLLK